MVVQDKNAWRPAVRNQPLKSAHHADEANRMT